ncbi:MAG: DUF4863 family protein [Myxococcales bacterium]|nr:DUF4863 family protein [Myxococcales bacterium]
MTPRLDALLGHLDEMLALVKTLDLSRPDDAKAALDAAFPVGGPSFEAVRALVREGVEARWLADREAGGVRFSRPRKASAEGEHSIDVVHMDRPGPGHTHPNGEVDLCFAVEGTPRFDGAPEGWTVYPPGSWHVPTVEDGVMDIVYFLPGGAIRFEPKP